MPLLKSNAGLTRRSGALAVPPCTPCCDDAVYKATDCCNPAVFIYAELDVASCLSGQYGTFKYGDNCYNIDANVTVPRSEAVTSGLPIVARVDVTCPVTCGNTPCPACPNDCCVEWTIPCECRTAFASEFRCCSGYNHSRTQWQVIESNYRWANASAAVNGSPSCCADCGLVMTYAQTRSISIVCEVERCPDQFNPAANPGQPIPIKYAYQYRRRQNTKTWDYAVGQPITCPNPCVWQLNGTTNINDDADPDPAWDPSTPCPNALFFAPSCALDGVPAGMMDGDCSGTYTFNAVVDPGLPCEGQPATNINFTWDHNHNCSGGQWDTNYEKATYFARGGLCGDNCSLSSPIDFRETCQSSARWNIESIFAWRCSGRGSCPEDTCPESPAPMLAPTPETETSEDWF
jgi:hypothetical protein